MAPLSKSAFSAWKTSEKGKEGDKTQMKKKEMAT